MLAEPLPLATLEALATLDGVAELEARQIVTTTERDGTVWYRLRPPDARRGRRPAADADAAVAASPTRSSPRRPAPTRCGGPMWQLDGSGAPDVEVLRGGAAAVFLTQPALAQRLAERALLHDPTPRSARLLADAHAELGEIGAARDAQHLAVTKVRATTTCCASGSTRSA